MSLLMQGFGIQEQIAPSEKRALERGASGLGEKSAQLYPYQLAAVRISGMPFFVQANPTSKLQILKRKRFTPQDRTARIQRSLDALNQPETLQLTAQEWRFFAEDPDLDDQD